MLRPPVVLSVDTLVWVQSDMRSAMPSAVFCLSKAFATVLPTFINMINNIYIYIYKYLADLGVWRSHMREVEVQPKLWIMNKTMKNLNWRT